MKLDWHPDNRFQLLENGEAYYPAVFEALEAAQDEVLIETFILFEDEVGLALQQRLIAIAQRGVRVDLTVDGWGSPDLSEGFLAALTQAGVRCHFFDPPQRQFLRQLKLLRRLHRKVVVVDGRVGFIGGINFSVDHLKRHGPESKQDYSLRLEGPIVRALHADALRMLPRAGRPAWWPLRRERQPRGAAVAPPTWRPQPPQGWAAFVKRDNHRHRNDIEHCYRAAIRTARHEVLIANAYFFPGWRLLRDLRRAARRGVQVQLILQGEPDMAVVRVAARLLYHALVRDGVQIHEYLERPLHGKVAVVDDDWVTIGSSNLDPLSLSLNLEANVLVRDAGLAKTLRDSLRRLQAQHCHQVEAAALPQPNMWRYLLGSLTYHLVRGWPRWLRWLPAPKSRWRSLLGRRVVETEAPVDEAPPTRYDTRYDTRLDVHDGPSHDASQAVMDAGGSASVVGRR